MGYIAGLPREPRHDIRAHTAKHQDCIAIFARHVAQPIATPREKS
jgi:hypothetical protein